MKPSSTFIAIMSGLILLALGMSVAAEEEDEFQPPTPREELAQRKAALAHIDKLAAQIILIIKEIPAITLDTEQTPQGYSETGERFVALFDTLNRYTENTATLQGSHDQLLAAIQKVYGALQQVAIKLMNASAANAFLIAKKNATGTLTQDDLTSIANANTLVIDAINSFLHVEMNCLPVSPPVNLMNCFPPS